MTGTDTADTAERRRNDRTTIVLLLATVTFFYQLDRNVIYITQEMIKREYALSDVQLGMLTGIAYGVANGLAGLPLGWLIDRANRKRLLGGIVLAWSLMTAACGIVTSYAAFFVARIGVGAAEAGGTPLSLSLVSDTFPPARRASAVGWVTSGYYLGTIVSFLAGGYLATWLGWRAVFLIYGLPGVVLSVLLLTLLREPPRNGGTDTPLRLARLLPEMVALLRLPGLRSLYLAVALTTMNAVGVFSWWSSFMIRTHGLDLRSVGLIGTLSTGICGIVCTLAAGFLADRLRRRSAGGPLFLLAAASAISCGAAMIALWAPGVALMTVGLCIAGATATLYIGPGNAVLSELAPAGRRGLAFVVAVIITNVCGTALGPLLVGALSDWLSRGGDHGGGLRLAMTIVSLVQLPVAFIYWRTGTWRSRNARGLRSPPGYDSH